jgi:replication fork clamp-binding protein CrfC
VLPKMHDPVRRPCMSSWLRAKWVDVCVGTQGASPSLFVSGQSFEVLVRLQIKRLEEPALQCVQMIYDELLRILAQLEQRKVRVRARSGPDLCI